MTRVTPASPFPSAHRFPFLLTFEARSRRRKGLSREVSRALTCFAGPGTGPGVRPRLLAKAQSRVRSPHLLFLRQLPPLPLTPSPEKSPVDPEFTHRSSRNLLFYKENSGSKGIKGIEELKVLPKAPGLIAPERAIHLASFLRHRHPIEGVERFNALLTSFFPFHAAGSLTE